MAETSVEQCLTGGKEGFVISCPADCSSSCRHWPVTRNSTNYIKEVENAETLVGLCNPALKILFHLAKSDLKETQRLYTEYLQLRCDTVPADSEDIIRSMMFQEGFPLQCNLSKDPGALVLLSDLLDTHFIITERIYLQGKLHYLLKNSSFYSVDRPRREKVQAYIIDERQHVTAVHAGASLKTVLDNIVIQPLQAAPLSDKLPVKVSLNDPDFGSIVLEDLCFRKRIGTKYLTSCDAYDLVYEHAARWRSTLEQAVALVTVRGTNRVVTRHRTKPDVWVRSLELHLVATLGRPEWTNQMDTVLMLPSVNAHGKFQLSMFKLNKFSELSKKAQALVMSDQNPSLSSPAKVMEPFRVPAHLCGIMKQMDNIRLLCRERDMLPRPKSMGVSSCCIPCQEVPIRQQPDERVEIPDSPYYTPLDLRSLMIMSGE